MRARWIGAALLATLATGAITVVVVRAGEALPGTTVAGLEVGRLDRPALLEAVRELADGRTKGELPVVAADVRATVDRDLVEVDLEATVDRALSAGRAGSPLAFVLGPLLGLGDRDVALAVEVDEQGLRTRVDEVAGQVDRPAAPGGFTVRGVTVTPDPPQEGRTLKVPAAVSAVAEALRRGRAAELELPVELTAPISTPAQVEQVVDAARRALATPYVLGTTDPVLRVTPADVAPLLRASPGGGTLALTVDAPALTALVTKKAAQIDVAAREAGFTVTSTPPVVDDKDDLVWAPVPAALVVEPGADGRAVDVPDAVTRLTPLILAGDPGDGLPLLLRATEPELTTVEAQTAGVSSLVGTFTTSFQAGQPRATNIRRIAELVDGAYIAPGERLSLNETAGERTRGRGFVADGAIVDGELVDEVGGGVSQFATTLFNAAFFAGLPIEQYQPHSFYISRYPAGRESTVYFGQIDVRVRNDTAHGLVVKTRSTPGSVTVELYGDNGGRQVAAEHGPRRPREDGGFRIDVTRTVSGGDGLSSRRVFRTSYDPPPED